MTERQAEQVAQRAARRTGTDWYVIWDAAERDYAVVSPLDLDTYYGGTPDNDIISLHTAIGA